MVQSYTYVTGYTCNAAGEHVFNNEGMFMQPQGTTVAQEAVLVAV